MIDPPIELELKLAVRSPEPGAVLDVLAGVRHLPGGFLLVARPSLRIVDTYLDLPNEGNTPSRLALRRRTKRVAEGREVRLLTLKGEDEGGGSSGISRRFELERPDHAEGRSEIVAALAERGLALASLASLPVRQRRVTHRRCREIRKHGSEGPAGAPAEDSPSGPILAELVLDSVTLGVAGSAIRFHEVEIEAEAGLEGGPTVLEELREALLAAAATLPLPTGSALVPWPLSKLETGLRIEALLSVMEKTQTAQPKMAPSAKEGTAAEAGTAPGGFAPPRDLLPEELDRLLE